MLEDNREVYPLMTSSRRLVIMRHALKNAMIPLLTVIGLQNPILNGVAIIFREDSIDSPDWAILSRNPAWLEITQLSPVPKGDCR